MAGTIQGERRRSERRTSSVQTCLADHASAMRGRGRRVKRQKPVSLTFASVAQEWLDYYPTLGRARESSMRGYRSFVEHHLVPAFGHLSVSAITADMV